MNKKDKILFEFDKQFLIWANYSHQKEIRDFLSNALDKYAENAVEEAHHK